MSAQKEKMSTGKAIFTVLMSVISVGMAIYFTCRNGRCRLRELKI